MTFNELFPHHQQSRLSPRRTVLEECRSDDSDFCREVVARGLLTEEQMHRAAERYQLGRSRSGKTIFWLIDGRGIIRDGHIGDSWVSVMLKGRVPELAEYIRPRRCLFGLHLLSASSPCQCVAMTESEASAVILSELFPDYVWLAVPASLYFTIDMLEPLRERKVIAYPSTDNTMSNYVSWLELADMARRLYRLDISVSRLLEDRASPEQKARCIGLVDFLFEQRTDTD